MMAEETEQAGKNAVDQPCTAKIEIPGDDDEASGFKKCGIIALVQCSRCLIWLCGSEELMHAIRCVKCDQWHCPEHHAAHRLSRDCEQRAHL